MIKILLRILLLAFLPLSTVVAHDDERLDSLSSDTVRWMRPDPKPSWQKRQLRKMENQLNKLNDIDTTYIEPQAYNYAFMLQQTNTYEVYYLHSRSGQSVTFAPDISLRVGPYFGYRWVFLGYTIDVSHLGSDKNQRQEYDLSLYSNKFGIDLYYRKTGNNYYIRSINLGDGIDTRPMRKVGFDGLRSSIKGFNAYYIFNHRRFSYPAAYSQSTVQRRSAGSPLLGIGYTKHSVTIDWTALNDLISEKMPTTDYEKFSIDSALTFRHIQYTDLSISGGYAYNWVFAHNWLMDFSASLALAYNRSSSDVSKKWYSFRDFSFNNFSLDGIFRYAIVWNTMKWYAGLSAILHTYTYHNDQFSTNNSFGSINIYAGFNFGSKNKNKKKSKKK